MRLYIHPELVQSGVFLWKLNGTGKNCSLEAHTSIKIPSQLMLHWLVLPYSGHHWNGHRSLKKKNANYHLCTPALGPRRQWNPSPKCQSTYSSQKRMETLFKGRVGGVSLTERSPSLPEGWQKVRRRKIPSRDKLQILKWDFCWMNNAGQQQF